jgi:lipopolysaccharide transport system permease protein
MSGFARYSNVKIANEGRAVFLSFDLRNESYETWRGEDGHALGVHIFDGESGTLIVDGPRAALPHEVPPGESAYLEVSFELPAEPGSYQAIVSLMREGVRWYYEAPRWPFLVVEAGGVRVGTRGSLARERFLRSLGRSFTYPMLNIWRNRSLIRTMVRRDILGRYRGSFGGVFWTVLNPLLLMLTYFFVFGVVLETRFGPDSSRAGFALYFLAGMLPWLAFSEAAGRAPGVMLEHRNFVKKLVFAVETLPVNLVAAGLVTEIFGLALFTAGFWAARGYVPASLLWLPVLIVPQVLFTAGMCWFLAALGVFVRDLGQVIGFLLTLWFFLTPICYPEASLPAWALPVLSKNPFYVLVSGYRDVFLEAQAPAFGPLWKLWLLSAAVFVGGHAWFYKLRKSFPDVI